MLVLRFIFMQNNDLTLVNLLIEKVKQKTGFTIATQITQADASKGFLLNSIATSDQVTFLRNGEAITLKSADIMNDEIVEAFCKMYVGKMTIENFKIVLTNKNKAISEQRKGRMSDRNFFKQKKKS